MTKVYYSILFLAALIFSGPMLLITPGCATAPGSDSLVVNAERLENGALDVMDGYVTIERDNRAFLWQISPDFKRVADRVRQNGFSYVNDVERLKEQYIAAKGTGDQDAIGSARLALQTACATLETALKEAQKYSALYSQAKANIK